MVFRLLSLLLFISTLSKASGIGPDEPNIVVIGNKTTYHYSSIKNIREIFRGKYALWPNGISVTVVLPAPKSEDAEEIAKYLYNNTAVWMQKYWLSLVFQGRSNPPIFLDTDQEIIDYVKKTEGAIGILKTDTRKIPEPLLIHLQ